MRIIAEFTRVRELNCTDWLHSIQYLSVEGKKKKNSYVRYSICQIEYMENSL